MVKNELLRIIRIWALFPLVIPAACGEADIAYDTARTIAYFEANKPAFERLGAQLAADPDFQEAVYCPPETCIGTPTISDEDQERLDQSSETYASALSKVSSGGWIYILRRGDGAVAMPGWGGGTSRDGGETSISMLFVPDQLQYKEGCETEYFAPVLEDELPFAAKTCVSALEGGWYIEEQTIIVEASGE